MKTLGFILLIAFSSSLIAQNDKTAEKMNISYSVNISGNTENYEKAGNQLYFSSNFLSYGQKNKLFSAFVSRMQQQPAIVSYSLPKNSNAIEFGKITDKNVYPVNNEYIVDVQDAPVSVKNGKIYSGNKLLIDFLNQKYLIDNEDLINKLNTLDFFETWDFDIETGTFTKIVRQIGLKATDENKHLLGFKTNEFTKSVIIENPHSSENYGYTSNDILIGKIAYYVDFSNNEKINQACDKSINADNSSNYHFISDNRRYELVKKILEYAHNELEKNNSVVYESSECRSPMTQDEIYRKFTVSDTIMVEDPNTYELLQYVVTDDKLISNISGLVFYETWYMDIKNFSLKKIVHAVSLVEMFYGYNDDYSGSENKLLKQDIYIQMKNQINSKTSPFYDRNIEFLSENLYTDEKSIFSLSGENLTKNILENTANENISGSFGNEIDSYFYDDIIKVGKVTSVDSIYIEDYYYSDGESILNIVPAYSYGLLNRQGKVVLPAEYSYISEFQSGLAIISKNDSVPVEDYSITATKYGVINEKGEIVVPCKYSDLGIINGNLIKVAEEYKYGILNVSGKQMLEVVYDEIGPLKNGMAKIRKGNKWGFINASGNMVLDCNNYYVSDFSKNRALVYNPGKLYYIDNKGQSLENAAFGISKYNPDESKTVFIGELDENGVMNKETTPLYYGLIDLDGKEIIPCIKNQILYIGNHIYGVEDSAGYWNIVNNTGQKINSTNYSGIDNFYLGLAKVSVSSADEYDEYGYTLRKYGYIDETGKEVVPAIYDEISKISDNVYLVKKEYKYGLVDDHNNEIMSLNYTKIEKLSDNIISAQIENKIGFYNSKGNEISPPVFDDVKTISNNLIPVKKDNKWSLYSFSSRSEIAQKYDYIGNFSDGFATVFNGQTNEYGDPYMGKYGLINREGNLIMPLIYEKIEYFNNDLVRIKQEGLWGYADSLGNIIIKCMYLFASDFMDEKAYVYKNNLFCTIDKEGNLIEKVDYGSKDENENGVKIIYVGGMDAYGYIDSYAENCRFGLMNSDGKIILPVIYKYIEYYNENLYSICIEKVSKDGSSTERKYGFVDKKGKMLLKPKYNRVEYLNEDMGKVFLGETDINGTPLKGKYGLINGSCKEIVPVKYDFIELVNDSIYKIFVGELNEYSNPSKGKYGLIDKSGKVIIEPLYDLIIFDSDYLRIYSGTTDGYGDPIRGKYGIMTMNGEQIVPVKYEFIGNFYDDSELVIIHEKGDEIEKNKNGKYGFIDKSGNIIVPPKYDYVENFQNEFAVVAYGEVNFSGYIESGKYSIIDQKGNERLPFKYDGIENIASGIFRTKLIENDSQGYPGKVKFGVIDQTGKEIVAPVYDYIDKFGENRLRLFTGQTTYYGSPETGKYGIADFDGNEILPVIYDQMNIYYIQSPVIIIKDGKQGLIDQSGKVITPVEYDFINTFYNDMASVKKDGKWGYIDVSGNPVIDCVYDYAGCFAVCRTYSEYYFDVEAADYANVYKDNKYYKINKTGDFIADCEYEVAESIDSGIKKVFVGTGSCDVTKQFGLMSANNEMILPCIYNRLDMVNSKLILAGRNNKIGFFNTKGQEIVSPRYSFIGELTNGLYRLYIDSSVVDGKMIIKKYGYADTLGKEVIPCTYDYASDFVDGKARVESNKKWFFINEKGEKISPKEYDYIWEYKNGFAPVYVGEVDPDAEKQIKGKYGFINDAFQEVIPPEYDFADFFENGYARVGKKINNKFKWGFIDKTGKEIVSPVKYDYVNNYNNSLSIVFIGKLTDQDEPYKGKYGVVDSTGKEILAPAYDYIDFENDQVLKIFIGETNRLGRPETGKFGLCNNKGSVILNPDYDLIIAPYNYSYATNRIVYTGNLKDGQTPATGKYGLFDLEKEKLAIPVIYDWVCYNDYDSLYRVYTGKTLEGPAGEWLPAEGKYSVISSDGKVVVNQLYDLIESYYNERALVKRNDKYGFIDREGKEVIPCIYDHADSFYYNDETTNVEKDGKSFKIDKSGQKVD